jgi:alpha-glucuronidase
MRTSLFLLLALTLRAETGYDAWLRYAPIPGATTPAVLYVADESPIMLSARDELIRGVRGMTGKTLRLESLPLSENAIKLSTASDLQIEPDGFQIRTSGGNVEIMGSTDRGVLYGVFAYLRNLSGASYKSNPMASIRWVNQWDNLDGTIERGYGGRSIFWDNGHVRADLTRVSDYGRLLASIGINGATINNVNADKRLLTPEYIPEIARIAAAFRPWGVRIAISVDFGSPQSVGGLDTFDPLDPRVAAWWAERAAALYKAVPDLAGFVLKADSEGRVGPSTYKRSHADAANVVARALKSHGGFLLYRGFVYDHHADWTNPKNDRARAAYDNFKPLDGQFDPNVIIQIKNGPIDFQVREPISPLFDALKQTGEALELQVTQEYMGQARHLVFLAPQWKEILPLKSVKGVVGVTNVGLDANWLGNHMSQANLYAFGRLAWDQSLTSEQIIAEWTRQTFSRDPKLVDAVSALQLKSWRVYENYTGPLGLQTLTDIVGNHYGVSVEASERNGWGQWHFADDKGVGMDRTVATGTGYIGQYPPAVAALYESLKTCPDDLLLFMHHVPYTHVLHSGKTVIQSLYDSHYEGAQAVENYAVTWNSLKPYIDDERFDAIRRQLLYQAGQAQVWRDAVTQWFLKASGIPDAKGRVGKYPGRVEAESMRLDGYQPIPVTPWESASGGKAVSCSASNCSAETTYDGPAGWFTIRTQYFDQMNGVSHFRLLIGKQVVDQWAADDHLPRAMKPDGTTSTRRTSSGIALRKGDVIRIEGTPEGGEAAPFDYLEIVR